MIEKINNKPQILSIYLTSLSQREIKKTILECDKILCVDVNKIIIENFNSEKLLNNVQHWILNQILLKRIEKAAESNIQKIFIILDVINKESTKTIRDLLKENNIPKAKVEIYKPDLQE